MRRQPKGEPKNASQKFPDTSGVPVFEKGGPGVGDGSNVRSTYSYAPGSALAGLDNN
jgi:hypothetical protein